jgi:hypothetical protein
MRTVVLLVLLGALALAAVAVYNDRVPAVLAALRGRAS